ncbi:MAG: hypothetical protein ACYC3Q_00875 [Gemmatimonadaceae bacterium]
MYRRLLALLLTATISQSLLLGGELGCVLQHHAAMPGMSSPVPSDPGGSPGAMRDHAGARSRQDGSVVPVTSGTDGSGSPARTPADCGGSSRHQECAATSHACGSSALPTGRNRGGELPGSARIATLVLQPRPSAALPPDDPPPRG